MTPGALAAASGLPRHEAIRLLAVAVGVPHQRVGLEQAVPPEAVARFHDLVDRRLEGMPLQHLEGTVQFGPLELLCDSRALIPRPETEELWALASAGEVPATIVDLCTGSGCLALGLKHSFPAARVVGVDLSPDAVDLARANAVHTGLDVDFIVGDLFDPLAEELRGRVDLLVANPPYLAAAELDDVPVEVRHDPELALVAGPVGTEVLAAIAEVAGEWLSPRGELVVEIGAGQKAEALRMFAAFEPQVVADAAGRARFVVGRLRRDTEL